MPGSCEVPMSFGSVHVERHGWQPLPQPSVAVATDGSTLGWDAKLGGWVVPPATLQPVAAYLSHMVVYAQDWAGAQPTSHLLPVAAWSVQDTTSAQTTSITMQDQPCDTWTGIPPP
jgi:hypothetical protein